jgi:hypothetical protein
VTAAERQKRYRSRQTRGVRVYLVPVKSVAIETLINAGRLTDAEAHDDAMVILELASLIEEGASLEMAKKRCA